MRICLCLLVAAAVPVAVVLIKSISPGEILLLHSDENDEKKEGKDEVKIMSRLCRFFFGSSSLSSSQPAHNDSSNQHPPDSIAYAIESHILQTQKPARGLGIQVDAFDEHYGKFLALKAPLHLNTNVHQTAFAGSLFSLGVLTSFYLVRQWMIQQPQQSEQHNIAVRSSLPASLLDRYTLVARSANIRYKRPVTTDWIVATSKLPEHEADTEDHNDNNSHTSEQQRTIIMDTFRQQLLSTGKAMVHINGSIVQPDPSDSTGTATVVACEYSVECCAYLPREANTS
jgi:hypothetical protein